MAYYIGLFVSSKNELFLYVAHVMGIPNLLGLYNLCVNVFWGGLEVLERVIIGC